MPGVISHLIAGSIIGVIGRYYFKNYFDGDNKIGERVFLAIVCLSFSCIPDFPLAIYYSTHILPFETLLLYHNIVHVIFTPLAIGAFVVLKYWIDTKNEPIWITGLWCIIVHIIMDIIIPEHGIWI